MKFPSQIESVFSRVLHGWHRDPTRDWLTLLIFVALLFSVILVWNMWLFDTVASGGVIGPAPATSPTVLGPASLNIVQEIFVSRAAEEAKYVNGTYHFIDPSQ